MISYFINSCSTSHFVFLYGASHFDFLPSYCHTSIEMAFVMLHIESNRIRVTLSLAWALIHLRNVGYRLPWLVAVPRDFALNRSFLVEDVPFESQEVAVFSVKCVSTLTIMYPAPFPLRRSTTKIAYMPMSVGLRDL